MLLLGGIADESEVRAASDAGARTVVALHACGHIQVSAQSDGGRKSSCRNDECHIFGTKEMDRWEDDGGRVSGHVGNAIWKDVANAGLGLVTRSPGRSNQSRPRREQLGM